ncbi:hypothetical protein CPB85DRAFT_1224749 [Mucidula mucida]|nr:hypothetical protein CPB85DRAFT_1224749 [Mucidula mucida]
MDFLSTYASPDVSTAPTPSLSVNYLPRKFPLGQGSRNRKGKDVQLRVPKLGGGVDAFSSGQSRIGDSDDSANDVYRALTGKRRFGKRSHRPTWNRFKWTLVVANAALSVYCITCLVFLILTWFNALSHADIVRVGNRSELVVSTIAACLGILTALIGWAGIMMNHRAFLAVYTFLLWVVFAFILAPGYMCFKRRAMNLDGKINQEWSQGLGVHGRQRIQNELGCCGYYSPYVEASVSQTCYQRTVLPGCKSAYINFERNTLKRWYTISFSLVGPHMLVIVAGLLCSDHVTYRFGKGMAPKAYRLTTTDLSAIMNDYAEQLAKEYGEDVASDVILHAPSLRGRNDL